MEKCAQDLGNSTKAVSSAIAQLLGEVAQGNENYAGTRAGPGWGLWGQAGEWELPEGWGDTGSPQHQGSAVKVPFPSFLSHRLHRHCSSGCGRWAAVTGPSC